MWAWRLRIPYPLRQSIPEMPFRISTTMRSYSPTGQRTERSVSFALPTSTPYRPKRKLRIPPAIPFPDGGRNSRSSVSTENGKISAWYSEDGIHIASGNTARYLPSAQVISWADAAERTEELLDSGTFAANLEVTEAQRHERHRIATEVWDICHDLSDEAKSQGYLSCLGNIRSTNYPEETERLTDELSNPAFRETLLSEYKIFMDQCL